MGYPADDAGAGNCGSAMNCGPSAVWSGRAGALLMFRDNENHEFFSYDSAIETNQLLDFREAQDDFSPGAEVRIARLDCCTQAGWEGVYWGLFPADATAYAYTTDVTGDLNPILNFDQLDYNGSPANAYVNDAQVHRLRRTSEIHNAEINRLWAVPLAGGACCSPWTVRTLVGFRYFRFEEGLEFAADVDDVMFTGAPDELYYTIDADNNLFGLQLGGRCERRFHGRWSFTCGAKAGVYGNSASATSHIGGAAGTATVNNGPNDGRPWLVSAEKGDVAFLGEVQAGLTCELAWNWRAVGEYRVLGASGLALPTNQIYHDLRGLQDVQLLATNGNLLLHGAFVGVERLF